MSTVRRTVKKTTKLDRSLCVGILTIPHLRHNTYGSSHIMKSYVDWFEEQGIRVLPIPYDTTDHESYFNMINGLFIPGTDKGYDLKNKKLIHSLARFIELSLAPGEYFPIWGTCFGFQLLLFVIGGFTTLSRHEANGLFPIHLTQEGKESHMMGAFSKRYRAYLEDKPSTLQYHEYGISPTQFMAKPHLRRFFWILATSLDEHGKEYVTAIEGKHYPIYGVQSHPERQRKSGPFLDFFIAELGKNRHHSYRIPFLRSIYTPHKCLQYKEQKHVLCYFF
jgi:gamma-glutamyl hydrolase